MSVVPFPRGLAGIDRQMLLAAERKSSQPLKYSTSQSRPRRRQKNKKFNIIYHLGINSHFFSSLGKVLNCEKRPSYSSYKTRNVSKFESAFISRLWKHTIIGYSDRHLLAGIRQNAQNFIIALHLKKKKSLLLFLLDRVSLYTPPGAHLKYLFVSLRTSLLL